MTNTLQFKLLKDDESYFLGALLTRLMPNKDLVSRKGVMVSILKMLAYNMPAAKDPAIPKFKDERTFKLSTMIKGASSSFNNLLKSFKVWQHAPRARARACSCRRAGARGNCALH